MFKKCDANCDAKVPHLWLRNNIFIIPFIATAEKGHGEAWHYHILFNQQNFSDDVLNTAIFKTVTALHLPLYSLKLEPITAYKDYVVSYCSKKMRVISAILDTDRIIPLHVLFNIPVKN